MRDLSAALLAWRDGPEVWAVAIRGSNKEGPFGAFRAGGGMGVSQGTSLRIVTERTKMAMPVTHIGLFPDVGGGLFFNSFQGQPCQSTESTATP